MLEQDERNLENPDESAEVEDEPEEDEELLTSDVFANMLGVQEEAKVVAKTTKPAEEPAEAEEAETDEESAEEPAKVAAPAVAVETKPKTEPTEPMIPQSKLDAIIAERLSRDRKSKLVQEIEAIEGKALEDILKERRSAKIETTKNQFGMTEEEAEKIVAAEEKVRLMEAENTRLSEEKVRLAKTTAYQTAKAEYINDPIVKRYEKEIEEFSKEGANIDYEPALFYTVGKALMKGDLRDFLKTSVEQKTLDNVAKRSKVRVEGAGTAAPAATEPRLAGHERGFARMLLSDVTDKPEQAYAAAKPKKY